MSLLVGVIAYLLIGFLGSAIVCRNNCVEAPLAPWLFGAMVGLSIIMVGTPVLWREWSR